MLVDVRRAKSPYSGKLLAEILAGLSISTRETDTIGWYKTEGVVGILFTEINTQERSAVSTILTRVNAALQESVSPAQYSEIIISYHIFPEKGDLDIPGSLSNSTFYPDLINQDRTRNLFRMTKRGMDIAGSTLALLLFAPVFLIIAAAVKLSSPGPVFFRQKRVGKFGKMFTLLKFRSMYANNDASVHEKYVKELISGKAQPQPGDCGQEGVFKLTRDSRITRVGAFLRRTSLDELPQFINVLCGEMSLVGPRPPLAYEVQAYDVWHRRRILESMPGITGLWQVNGRSRVKFDEMVRLDLRYARTWSPWLDMKILLQTPKAMFSKEGAY
jgi:lipopolysaccharide/colanic/teichoic acid biosynthesis glycosyltransferase